MRSRKLQVRESIALHLAKAKLPLSANEIMEKIEGNKTTIYRALYKLIADGEVIELDFGDRIKRYEIATLSHHHHLICAGCKKVEEVKITEVLANEEKELENKTGFGNVKHSLEFYGVCPNCK